MYSKTSTNKERTYANIEVNMQTPAETQITDLRTHN